MVKLHTKLGVCGSTRTRWYVPDPFPRVRVGSISHGSGTGMTSTGTGIPGFTRKEHCYFGARTFYFCVFSKLLMIKQLQYMARENSILLGAYNRLLT